MFSKRSVFLAIFLTAATALVGCATSKPVSETRKPQGNGTVGSGSLYIARPFRLLPRTVNGDYGIGWGVINENTDFEAIEKNNESEKFVNEKMDKIQNYVVDIETNQILATVGYGEVGVRFNIGGQSYGNHYDISLLAYPLGYDSGSRQYSGVVVSENIKWHGGISYFLIAKDKDGSQVISDCKDCNKSLDDQIAAKVKEKFGAKIKARYDRLTNESVIMNATAVNEEKKCVEFNLSMTVPKSVKQDEELDLDGCFSLTKTANDIKISLKELSLK